MSKQWTVEHVRIGRNPGGNQRWGTDIIAPDGRVLKFTGKLTRERAIDLAAKYLADADILAGVVGVTVAGVAEMLDM